MLDKAKIFYQSSKKIISCFGKSAKFQLDWMKTPAGEYANKTTVNV